MVLQGFIGLDGLHSVLYEFIRLYTVFRINGGLAVTFLKIYGGLKRV